MSSQNGRPQEPLGIRLDGDVLFLAAGQNLKIDRFAPRVDQPVFPDAGVEIGIPQSNRVLANRSLADVLADEVGTSPHFDHPVAACDRGCELDTARA